MENLIIPGQGDENSSTKDAIQKNDRKPKTDMPVENKTGFLGEGANKFIDVAGQAHVPAIPTDGKGRAARVKSTMAKSKARSRRRKEVSRGDGVGKKRRRRLQWARGERRGRAPWMCKWARIKKMSASRKKQRLGLQCAALVAKPSKRLHMWRPCLPRA